MGFLLNMLVLLILLYFVPSIIALIRLHQDFFLILFVNILLGWTFLGWILTLAWAIFGGHQPNYPGRRKYDVMQRLKKDFARGRITEEEYFRRKRVLEDN